MRIGGLFFGYGGLDLAVQSVYPDASLAWYSEIDKGACKIAAHRFPDVPNVGDVTTVDWSQVEPVDILTGGFPCQDLSHAGKRAGMVNGTRSNLWHEFVRAIAYLRPKVVIAENVRGLLSGKAEFDEPNDFCVCGWTYRRGGLRTDSGESGRDVSPPRDDRDDREGSCGAGADERPVRRQDQVGQGCDGEVGRGLLLDGGGRRGDTPTTRDAAAPDLEGGTGADRIEGGGDPAGAAAQVGELADWPEALDGRGAAEVPDAEASDARTEREGAESAAYDPATGGRVTHCQACGGSLGDRPSRSVERSWMGVVLRELARLGYDCRWHGLRAADVGAPHGRWRVFVVATDACHGAGHGEWARAGSGQGGAATADADGRVHVTSGARADQRAVPHGDGAGTPAALLPTPSCSDTNGAGAHGDGGLDLRTAVSLMPTPRTTDGTKGGPGQRGSSGDPILPSAVALLPTPAAQEPGGTLADYHARLKAHDGRVATFAPLAMAVQLLPTPSVADVQGGRKGRSGDRPDELLLNGIAAAQRWGHYAAAITRWEQALGRPAPAPTQTSTKGNPQLSARFVEWLMGLPDGWVTDAPGITRNEALKALGNGVVPQQGAAALRVMASWEAAA